MAYYKFEYSEAIRPHEEQPIWRYLSLPKFCDLLETGTLYFARADQFLDNFEASLTGPTADALLRLQEDLEIAARSGAIVDGARTLLTDRRKLRKFFWVSCWHMNPIESVAMWSLYVHGSEGVAIRTRARRAYEAMTPPDGALLVCGRVTYLDYQNALFDALDPFTVLFQKRMEYRHEEELRFVLHELPKEYLDPQAAGIFLPDGFALRLAPQAIRLDAATPDYRRVPVQWNELIEAIYTAPGASDRVRSEVSRLAAQYVPDATLQSSALEGQPRFMDA